MTHVMVPASASTVASTASAEVPFPCQSQCPSQPPYVEVLAVNMSPTALTPNAARSLVCVPTMAMFSAPRHPAELHAARNQRYVLRSAISLQATSRQLYGEIGASRGGI